MSACPFDVQLCLGRNGMPSRKAIGPCTPWTSIPLIMNGSPASTLKKAPTLHCPPGGRFLSWERPGDKKAPTLRLRLAMVLSGMLVLTAATAQVPEITIDPGNLPPEILERVIDAIDSIAEMADDVDGGEGL